MSIDYQWKGVQLFSKVGLATPLLSSGQLLQGQWKSLLLRPDQESQLFYILLLKPIDERGQPWVTGRDRTSSTGQLLPCPLCPPLLPCQSAPLDSTEKGVGLEFAGAAPSNTQAPLRIELQQL